MQQKWDLPAIQNLFDPLLKLLTAASVEKETLMALFSSKPIAALPRELSPVASYLHDANQDLVRMVKGIIGIALLNYHKDDPQQVERQTRSLTEVVRDRNTTLCLSFDLSEFSIDDWSIFESFLLTVPHITAIKINDYGLENFTYWIFLSKAIKLLSKLREIDFSENPIGRTLPPHKYASLGAFLSALELRITLRLSKVALSECADLPTFQRAWRDVSLVESLDLSQNELYKLGEKLPDFLSSVLGSNKIHTLNLAENELHKLTPEVWKALCVTLLPFKGLHLDLARNGLGLSGNEPFEALSSLSLVSLNLAGNALSALRIADTETFSKLFSNPTLTSLNLSANKNSQMNVDDLPLVFLAISASKQLVRLDLSHNGLQDLPLLHRLVKLRTLNLSHNHLGASCNWGFLGEAFAKLEHLMVLDLSNNRLGEVTSGAWIEAVRKAEPETLNIRGCGLDFQYNWEALSSNLDSIAHLDLSDNRLNGLNEDQVSLFSQLSSKFPEVTELNLSDMELPSLLKTNQTSSLIKKFICGFSELKKVYFSGDELSGLNTWSLGHFLEMILLHPSLEEIEFIATNPFLTEKPAILQQIEMLVLVRSAMRQSKSAFSGVKSDTLVEYIERLMDELRQFTVLTKQFIDLKMNDVDYRKNRSDRFIERCSEIKKDLWNSITQLIDTMPHETGLKFLAGVASDHPFFASCRLEAFRKSVIAEKGNDIPRYQAFYNAMFYFEHRGSFVRLTPELAGEFDRDLKSACIINDGIQNTISEDKPLTPKLRYTLFQYIWLYNIKLACAPPISFSVFSWLNSYEKPISNCLAELPDLSLLDIDYMLSGQPSGVDNVATLWEKVGLLLPDTEGYKSRRLIWKILDNAIKSLEVVTEPVVALTSSSVS